MNATQEAKLNMFRATQKHCNDNPTILRLGTFFLRRVSAQDFVSWLAGLAVIRSNIKQYLSKMPVKTEIPFDHGHFFTHLSSSLTRIPWFRDFVSFHNHCHFTQINKLPIDNQQSITNVVRSMKIHTRSNDIFFVQ